MKTTIRATLGVILVLGATSAAAQDLGLGYQFQHTSCCDGKTASYPAGFNVDVSGPVNPALSIVGQLDWSHRSDESASETITAFGAGVRWNVARSANATPFIDVLFGGAHDARDAGSDTNPGMQIGGGVAIPVNKGTSAVLQVDFRRAFKDGGDANAIRFVGGLRLNFKK